MDQSDLLKIKINQNIDYILPILEKNFLQKYISKDENIMLSKKLENIRKKLENEIPVNKLEKMLDEIINIFYSQLKQNLTCRKKSPKNSLSKTKSIKRN